ncbi:HEAT repeat domain-containing protein [Solidesulfovibrio carbinolicus]|uniref:HEAT repeat domain-containing protein n=1 Tax=Solidesulfovibrio carbinolicus TaxID=296842 RepID=UPI001010E8EB|nr:hypothetical protein [Solidesulfovibrio carbinolicus]
MELHYPRDIARSWREYNKNTCFFLMPFKDKFRKVYSSILQELKKIGFYCTRVDLEDQEGAIINRIVKGIISSHFVVVDLTDQNSNVFYELGLSHALKDSQNVILISQSMDFVPADIKHLRVIVYSLDDMFELVDRVRQHVEKYMHGFDIKLSIRQQYGHLFCNENASFEIEDFFSPLIVEYPKVLLPLVHKKHDPSLGWHDIMGCFFKIRNGIGYNIKTNRPMARAITAVYIDMLILYQDISEIKSEILQALSREEIVGGFSEREKLDQVINLVFKLVTIDSIKQEAIDWIIKYLSRPKVAGVDLARARVEEFVIKENAHELNAQLTKVLSSPVDLQRENISDILGEIGDPSFVSPLENALAIEKNYYAARSIITALGKIAIPESGVRILSWIKVHSNSIVTQNKEFVFQYSGLALSSIDYKNGTTYVDQLNAILASLPGSRTVQE